VNYGLLGRDGELLGEQIVAERVGGTQAGWGA
jgi:hypothetical protein